MHPARLDYLSVATFWRFLCRILILTRWRDELEVLVGLEDRLGGMLLKTAAASEELADI